MLSVLPVIIYNIVFGISYYILFEINCICFWVLILIMTAIGKCSDCHYFRDHLDFGHATCPGRRTCLTRGGYVPATCVICRVNWKYRGQLALGFMFVIS